MFVWCEQWTVRIRSCPPFPNIQSVPSLLLRRQICETIVCTGLFHSMHRMCCLLGLWNLQYSAGMCSNTAVPAFTTSVYGSTDSKAWRGGMDVCHRGAVVLTTSSFDNTCYGWAYGMSLVEVFSFWHASRPIARVKLVNVGWNIYYWIIKLYAFGSAIFADGFQKAATTSKRRRRLNNCRKGGRDVYEKERLWHF